MRDSRPRAKMAFVEKIPDENTQFWKNSFFFDFHHRRAPRVFRLSMLNYTRIEAHWQKFDVKFETASKNVVCRKNSGGKYSTLKKSHLCDVQMRARNDFCELRAFEARWQNFNARSEFTTKSYPRKLKFRCWTQVFRKICLKKKKQIQGGHLHTFFKKK